MNIFTKLINFFNTSKLESESGKNSTSLTISKHLQDFLENEVLDGLDITKEHFWSSFEKIINEFSPRNKALLEKREDIQTQIDNWHLEHKGKDLNYEEYKSFLTDIGYIAPRSPDFSISTVAVCPPMCAFFSIRI